MQQKHSKRWMVWVLALAVLGGGGWWFRVRDANGAGAAGYKTVALEKGEIVQTVTANGELGAVQTVMVGSEVSGKIMELFADYNSMVTNGQVLAKLDASTYERQLEQAEAELESAKASLKLARANFKRAEELKALELVSQADYDQAEATLAQAQASLQVREASLSKVRVDLEKTTIFAPMDGVVISRAVDVGQTVAASLNAPTLFMLAQDLRQMRIEAQISEADVGGVEEGQAVNFTVDAYPARTFTGRVSQVRFEPVTNQGVVNYIAIVDVDNGDLKLRPGMTANAAVTTAHRENALRLPNSALRFRPPEGAAVAEPERPAGRPEGDGPEKGAAKRERGEWQGRERREGNGAADAAHKTVYVVDEKGGLRAQPVELGISDGTWTEVLGPGPQEGELIATGIQTAEEKEKISKAGTRPPFMPRPPGGPR
jgi:HlyD family secretion protein